MITILFTLVIGNMLSFYLTFWTSTTKLADRRRNGFNILTTKGRIFVALALLSIIFSIIQFLVIDNATQKENEKRDKALIDNNYNNLSNLGRIFNISTRAIQSRADSNTINITENFTRVLADYNLKYDAKQNKIEELVKDVKVESPTLFALAENGKMGLERLNDSDYKWSVFCQNAAAIDVNLSIVVAHSNDQMNFVSDGEGIVWKI